MGRRRGRTEAAVAPGRVEVTGEIAVRQAAQVGHLGREHRRDRQSGRVEDVGVLGLGGRRRGLGLGRRDVCARGACLFELVDLDEKLAGVPVVEALQQVHRADPHQLQRREALEDDLVVRIFDDGEEGGHAVDVDEPVLDGRATLLLGAETAAGEGAHLLDERFFMGFVSWHAWRMTLSSDGCE